MSDSNDDAADTMDDHEWRLMASATVMIVDDEPINMEILQIHLETEGY